MGVSSFYFSFDSSLTIWVEQQHVNLYLASSSTNKQSSMQLKIVRLQLHTLHSLAFLYLHLRIICSYLFLYPMHLHSKTSISVHPLPTAVAVAISESCLLWQHLWAHLWSSPEMRAVRFMAAIHLSLLLHSCYSCMPLLHKPKWLDSSCAVTLVQASLRWRWTLPIVTREATAVDV